jgi:N-acetylmuramoyl-L-alanine amidase
VTLDGQSVSEVKSPAAAPGRPAPEVKSAGALAAKSVAEAKPPVTIAAARPEFRKDPLRNDSPAAEHAASNGGREGRPPADLASKAAETRQAALMEPAPDKPPVPSLPPPKPAGRLSTGERNMIRTLGLKLGRVVIDPGHGGHDQGTAGATGLLEKELVLDVARRLGDLIEERLGSEVLYTRTTDVFVPLEERGAFANERRGDLFISVHANSSPYKSISGAETYYLNFTNVKADLEVAARENASTNKSIFELRELLQKIVLKDKIGESREFAARVQRELASAWSKMNETARNRGVKKAPFVVLIGASMPSILAEIGFVSNARDEALMKKPEQRQKLAEALFRGVSQYAAGLSQTQVAQRAKP